jgi:hypothetical protein
MKGCSAARDRERARQLLIKNWPWARLTRADVKLLRVSALSDQKTFPRRLDHDVRGMHVGRINFFLLALMGFSTSNKTLFYVPKSLRLLTRTTLDFRKSSDHVRLPLLVFLLHNYTRLWGLVTCSAERVRDFLGHVQLVYLYFGTVLFCFSTKTDFALPSSPSLFTFFQKTMVALSSLHKEHLRYINKKYREHFHRFTRRSGFVITGGGLCTGKFPLEASGSLLPGLTEVAAPDIWESVVSFNRLLGTQDGLLELDAYVAADTLVTPQEFSTLTTAGLASSAEQNCVICMERVAAGMLLRRCSHSFHEKCLRDWYTERPGCPICRLTHARPFMLSPPTL